MSNQPEDRHPTKQDRHPERSEGSPRIDSVPHHRDPSLRSGRRESTLKQIMFNIARLPSLHQHWLLRQLSSSELKILNQYRGLKLLQEAQQFRTLKACDGQIPLNDPHEALPEFCQQLAMNAPLYIAIIIEQGDYPWKDMFLDQFDPNGEIQTSLKNQVMDVKPMVKQAVLDEWERSVSFEHLLDETHG